MRIAIRNRTYRNVLGIDRGNVTRTDVLRQELACALFHARHVVRRFRLVAVWLQALKPAAKQAAASAAGSLERASSSMCQPPRWLAERSSPLAFVTSG